MKEIKQSTLMLGGCILFIFTGLFNIISLSYTYAIINWAATAAALCGIFFNFLLAYIFYGMYKQNGEMEGRFIEDTQPDIQEIIK